MKLNKNFITAFFLLMILIFSFLFRLPLLNVPLEADEGEIAYIAQRVQQGDIPYKDAVHQKTPGMIYLYLLIFKILGKEVSDIRIVTFLFVLLEIFLIYKLANMLFGKSVGLISSAIFGVITADVNLFGFMAKAEIFMIAPIIGSIILLISGLRKKSGFLFFVSGILNGIAFLLKQSAIFNCAFIFIFLLVDFLRNKENEAFNKLIKRYVYFISGFIIVLLPVFIYFWIKGAWNDFFYWTFLHNFKYIYRSPYKLFDKYTILRFFRQLKRMLNVGWAFWSLCIYAIYRFLNTKKRENILITGWFIFMFLSVFSGLRFFSHYFLLLMPPLAISSAWGLCEIIRKIKRISSPIVKKIVLITTICVVFVGSLIYNVNCYFISSLAQIPILDYVYGNYTYAKTGTRYLGNYINQHTSPHDTVLLFGQHLPILFYANRKSATKYIIFFPVMHTVYKDALKKQKEIFQEIIKNDPKYIVVSIGYSVYFDEKYIVNEIGRLIKNAYYLEGIIYEEDNVPKYIFDKEQLKSFCKYKSVRVKIFRQKEKLNRL